MKYDKASMMASLGCIEMALLKSCLDDTDCQSVLTFIKDLNPDKPSLSEEVKNLTPDHCLRQEHIHNKVRQFFRMPPEYGQRYLNENVIPYKFIKEQCNRKIFRGLDMVTVVNLELAACCDRGILIEAPADWVLKKFNSVGKVYYRGPAFNKEVS